MAQSSEWHWKEKNKDANEFSGACYILGFYYTALKFKLRIFSGY
jgi:hypothetical protein